MCGPCEGHDNDVHSRSPFCIMIVTMCAAPPVLVGVRSMAVLLYRTAYRELLLLCWLNACPVNNIIVKWYSYPCKHRFYRSSYVSLFKLTPNITS